MSANVIDLGSNVYAKLYSCAHSETSSGAIIQYGGTPEDFNDHGYDHDEVCVGTLNWCAECPGPTWTLHSLDPLHIEPSVRTICHNHPEHHGFIRGGKWVLE